jgi:hypothetical protein
MSPTCLAPQTSQCKRVLPHNRFDRLVNFVKFDMVEPLWSAHVDMAEKKVVLQAD